MVGFVEAVDCGLLVEPENPDALAEAIRTLYADPGLRERLGRNGRSHVEGRYTPEMVARRYAELLERVSGYPDDSGRGEEEGQGEGETRRQRGGGEGATS